jgi:hypothetical protein
VVKETKMAKKMTQRVRVLSALRDGCTLRRVNYVRWGRHTSWVDRVDRLTAPDGRQDSTADNATEKMLTDGLIEKGARIPYPEDLNAKELDGVWLQLTEAGRAAAARLPAVTIDELYPIYVPDTDEERAQKSAKATLRLMFTRGERLLKFGSGDSWALQPMAARGYTRHWGARHVDPDELAAMGDSIEDFVDTDGKTSKRLTAATVALMTKRQRKAVATA